MGPWDHGGWAKETGKTVHNHIYFGDSISTFFQREIERNFFAHNLKSKNIYKLPEAYMFDTGSKEWKKFEQWPPIDIEPVSLHFGENGQLKYCMCVTQPNERTERKCSSTGPLTKN